MAAGIEIIGVFLVVIAIIKSFVDKKDNIGFALIIVLLILLRLLGYL